MAVNRGPSLPSFPILCKDKAHGVVISFQSFIANHGGEVAGGKGGEGCNTAKNSSMLLKKKKKGLAQGHRVTNKGAGI